MKNFIAVGNDELGEDVGDKSVCPNCKQEHDVIWGTEKGVETKTIGGVKCTNGKLYLVAISGRKFR